MATATQSKHFLGLLTEQTEALEKGIKVLALAFVEGEQTDALGSTEKFSAAKLKKFAKNSNAWLESGEEIPLFESSHNLEADGYSNRNKVGLVTGPFTTQVITEELLPKPEFSDLIGKTGLYTYIEFLDENAIDRYQRKLAKPISVGLDDFGMGRMVFEISLVPWGAVRGAMLFGRNPEKPKIHALTLDGAMAESEGMWSPLYDQIEDLCWRFQKVVMNITNTSDEELAGRDRNALKRQAIADLDSKLKEILGIQTLPTVPVLASKPMSGQAKKQTTETVEPVIETDEIQEGNQDINARFMALESRVTTAETRADEADARAEAAEKELAVFKKNQTISDRYLRLKQWASKLNTLGKFSKAAYLEFFPEGEQLSDAVARFNRTPAEGEEAAGVSLDDIEAALKYADKFATPVTTGSVAGSDPLPVHPTADANQAEHEADMARFERRRNPQKAS